MPQHPGALTRSAKNVVGLPGVPCPEATTPCGRKILLNPSDRNPPCPKGCLHEIPRALGGGRPSCFQQQERVRVLLAHAAPSPRRRGSWRGGGEKQRPLLRRRRNEARDPQATCEFASPVEQLRFSVERTEGHRHPATSNVWLPFSELPVPPSMPLHHLAGVYRELIQLASSGMRRRTTPA
ncbi:transmembrane protein 218 isoform X2 [Larus michahellis]|uniref:transmembrane protein 218 isoform X2 n=1 Tax=Larus michahellis TaxID=119627 RepID=UPI003D9BE27A